MPGTVYSFNKFQCCSAKLVDQDGNPRMMVPVQVEAFAKDLGSVAGGEKWEKSDNLVFLKNTQDWVVTSSNTPQSWVQNVVVQSPNIRIEQTFSSMKVGGLTDDDFTHPEHCSAPCSKEQRDELIASTGFA